MHIRCGAGVQIYRYVSSPRFLAWIDTATYQQYKEDNVTPLGIVKLNCAWISINIPYLKMQQNRAI